jgi:hypothetical protein
MEKLGFWKRSCKFCGSIFWLLYIYIIVYYI